MTCGYYQNANSFFTKKTPPFLVIPKFYTNPKNIVMGGEKNIKSLILFTRTYPYKGEEFINEEIIQLSNYFHKIYLVPLENYKNKRSLPNNVCLVELNLTNNHKTMQVIRKDFFLIVNILCRNIYFKSIRVNFKRISLLLRLISKSKVLEEWVHKNKLNNEIFYSYWLDEWATILSILKIKKSIKNFFSRAHGFDLYDYRYKTKKIPFRDFQLKNINKLFFISKDVISYFKKNFSAFNSKYQLSYLGTKDYGLSKYNPAIEISILTISRIDKNKQLHKLIEVFKSVKKSVIWTHFGGGELEKKIRLLSKELPNNISVNIYGETEHKKMIKIIKNTHFDIFINVSKFEGLPVSMMEALSFGIPIFATKTGGVQEFFKDDVGKLYSANFKEQLIFDLEVFKESNFSSKKIRENCRKLWEENFDSKTNYLIFAQEIQKHLNN